MWTFFQLYKSSESSSSSKSTTLITCICYVFAFSCHVDAVMGEHRTGRVFVCPQKSEGAQSTTTNMARPPRLVPWIEQLILNYGSQEEGSGCGPLKTDVIGVGQMSPSQAPSCGAPSGLLFLSDGVLQIPAVLTAAAWEHLQEFVEIECFTSLVNSTVYIHDYHLQFQMAPEQTKCRFFLLVGKLVLASFGPVADRTPGCTTLASVRKKVVETWKALQGVENSQWAGSDLSQLLGEWQQDCLREILQNVRESLTVASSSSGSPQPSTSTFTPAPSHPHLVTATSWDIDRVTYKGAKSFSVPIKCLIVPEEDVLQLQASREVSVCKPSGITQAEVGDADRRTDVAAVAEIGCDTAWNSPPHLNDSTLYEHMFARMTGDIRPLANPWDIFPPPCDTSSDSCQEATPPHSLSGPATATPKPDHAIILTSTHLPVRSQSPSESSFFPPYQKPLLSGILSASSACAEQGVKEENQMLAKNMEESWEKAHRNAKRKRSTSPPRALHTSGEEDGQLSGSPPFWLFESQAGQDAAEARDHKWGPSAVFPPRKTCTVHRDGRSFSYSYQASGQNLQDFSGFRVDDSLLQWAVNILLPTKANDPHNMSGDYKTSAVCREQGPWTDVQVTGMAKFCIA